MGIQKSALTMANSAMIAPVKIGGTKEATPNRISMLFHNVIESAATSTPPSPKAASPLRWARFGIAMPATSTIARNVNSWFEKASAVPALSLPVRRMPPIAANSPERKHAQNRWPPVRRSRSPTSLAWKRNPPNFVTLKSMSGRAHSARETNGAYSRESGKMKFRPRPNGVVIPSEISMAMLRQKYREPAVMAKVISIVRRRNTAANRPLSDPTAMPTSSAQATAAPSPAPPLTILATITDASAPTPACDTSGQPAAKVSAMPKAIIQVHET